MKNLLVAFFLTCGTPLFAQSFHEPGNLICSDCHQAHASQYPNALRWDPTSGSGGTAGNRSKCGKCHDK